MESSGAKGPVLLAHVVRLTSRRPPCDLPLRLRRNPGEFAVLDEVKLRMFDFAQPLAVSVSSSVEDVVESGWGGREEGVQLVLRVKPKSKVDLFRLNDDPIRRNDRFEDSRTQSSGEVLLKSLLVTELLTLRLAVPGENERVGGRKVEATPDGVEEVVVALGEEEKLGRGVVAAAEADGDLNEVSGVDDHVE
jgi:hypothetical protein